MSRLELLSLIEERERRQKYNAVSTIFPDTGPLRRELYPKHLEFLSLGRTHRIRAFMAGNRVGKSTAGTVELSYHLTGRYPDWWTGKRFDRPIRAWAASDTQSTTRDALQRKLLGNIGDVGSGWIPKDAIGNTANKSQPSGAIDFAQVRHVSGGYSHLVFKSFDMGREKFQADDIDAVLLDEEPRDYGIYSECVTRTATTNGIVMLTFTSLRGITPLVCRFMPEFARGTDFEADVLDDESSRAIVVCGWDDVPHLDEKTKRELKAEYAPHELQARTQGIPSVGIGQIYPVPESDFVITPMAIPPHWPRVCALDPGWNRTAAVWGAHDIETDTVYLYSEHYRSYAEVEVHAAAVKARGIGIPVVSDEATDVEGTSVIGKYAKQGLLIRKTKKSDKDARIQEVYSRLSTGRMKVFSTLHNWLFEFRMYRRDEQGRIASEHDHLMDACVTGDTLVCTPRGGMPIRDLVGTSGAVVTRSGAIAEYIGARLTLKSAPVITLAFDDGSHITCTHDHPFLTPSGWIRADRMVGKQCYNGISQAIQSRQWKSSFVQKPVRNLTELATTFAAHISSVVGCVFIVVFGRPQMAGASRADTTSTTKMETDQTMFRRTLSSSRHPLTSATIFGLRRECRQGRLSMPLASGTGAMRVGRGMRRITKKSNIFSTWMGSLRAFSAARDSLQGRQEQISFARLTVATRRVSHLVLTMRNALAWCAASITWSIATLKNKPARAHAVQCCLSKTDAGTADVYCLTVPGISAFCVGTGQVVHNTAYLVQSGLSVARPLSPPRDHIGRVEEQTFGIY